MFAPRSSYIPKSQSAAPSMSVAGSVQWQNRAQWSSSSQEHQMIAQSISSVQKIFFFHSSLWNQLDSSPKNNTRMSHLKLFFRQVSEDWVAICPLPCNNMPGNPWGALPGTARRWTPTGWAVQLLISPSTGLNTLTAVWYEDGFVPYKSFR